MAARQARQKSSTRRVRRRHTGGSARTAKGWEIGGSPSGEAPLPTFGARATLRTDAPMATRHSKGRDDERPEDQQGPGDQAQHAGNPRHAPLWDQCRVAQPECGDHARCCAQRLRERQVAGDEHPDVDDGHQDCGTHDQYRQAIKNAPTRSGMVADLHAHPCGASARPHPDGALSADLGSPAVVDIGRRVLRPARSVWAGVLRGFRGLVRRCRWDARRRGGRRRELRRGGRRRELRRWGLAPRPIGQRVRPAERILVVRTHSGIMSAGLGGDRRPAVRTGGVTFRPGSGGERLCGRGHPVDPLLTWGRRGGRGPMTRQSLSWSPR